MLYEVITQRLKRRNRTLFKTAKYLVILGVLYLLFVVW